MKHITLFFFVANELMTICGTMEEAYCDYEIDPNSLTRSFLCIANPLCFRKSFLYLFITAYLEVLERTRQ